jgi:hypothetical protein
VRRRALALLLLCTLAALLAAGCGVGGGDETPQEVRLRVTEAFGTEPVTNRRIDSIPRGDTVLRLLQREMSVRTRFGGGFVQAIDGRTGGRDEGRPLDWFFYVNGIESSTGAGEVRLNRGDRVWWDLHDWGATMRVPAVVGSFPEPFLSGSKGKRIPARVECAKGAERECDEVTERLENAGVTKMSRSVVSQTDEGGVLRILVGRWTDLRLDPTAFRIARGPEQSGVYARIDASGRRLDVLDQRGRTVRTLGAGTGLVAATRKEDNAPVWVVTGTDAVGLAAAAAAVDESVLSGRFAVAIEDGQAVALPAVTP